MISAATGAWVYSAFATTPVQPTTFEEFPPTSKTVRVAKESPNSVLEGTFDQNQDGNEDEWMVSIRRFSEYEAQYILSDENFDGIPDQMIVMEGNSPTSLSDIDQDYDGSWDLRVLLSRSRVDESVAFKYQDLDIDGRLDEMYEYKNETFQRLHIRIDNSWIHADREKRGDIYRAYRWVDGEKIHMVFQNGEWVESSQSTSDEKSETPQ